MTRVGLLIAGIIAGVCSTLAGAAERRGLEPADFDRLMDVEAPACSSDGQWIAYTVTTSDTQADELRTALWTVRWQGGQPERLVADAASITAPSFSPDGRYVSYLASQSGDEHSQLYLLDRRGGPPVALTGLDAEIRDYRWSPDGQHIVLSVSGVVASGAAADAQAGGAAKVPKPIVIDGFQFKQDVAGYVTAEDRAHLYLLDVNGHTVRPLTLDPRYEDTHPAWSPDGRRIAFLSNHDAEADRTGELELYVVDAGPGAVPARVARFFSPNYPRVLWLPDGRRIAYTIGRQPELNAYISDRLALVGAGGGEPVVLTDALDRAIAAPSALPGSTAIAVLVEDDRSEYPARVDIGTGQVVRSVSGALSAVDQCSGAGHVAVLASTDSVAPEIYALKAGELRRLTHHSADLLAQLKLGRVEDVSFHSADGTEIHGLLTRPVDYQAGQRYPLILWLHGGPVGQDQHGLQFDTWALELERQLFASHGYAVLAVNYRGSSGRGSAFQQALLRDWGHREVEDVLAAADFAVRSGIADPARLGVGGWSYGGVLTNYVIASDSRFAAAISGAATGFQLSTYGTDEYAIQDLYELGPPWRNQALWEKVSYPFLHADRIRTPTLFMGGDKDFNQAIAGSEQMYQALRTTGTPTQLVVYPGQFHILTRPSYIRDRNERRLAWFDRYLKAASGAGATP